MSFDPAEETTREDVIRMIADALAQRMWGEHDWTAIAERILQRIEDDARWSVGHE